MWAKTGHYCAIVTNAGGKSARPCQVPLAAVARGTNGYGCSRAISRDTSFRWIKHRQRFLSKQIVYRYMTKNPFKKKEMWLLLAVSATSMMCLRNSCELLGSPCGMWIPIAPAGEAACGCGPADGRLRPPKRIAECANFHKTTWGWKSKKMVNQPL